MLSSNIPTAYQIFVPECSEDGKYKPIQHHEGTGYSWCVDVDTGDVLNGTKVANETPKCPEKTGVCLLVFLWLYINNAF